MGNDNGAGHKRVSDSGRLLGVMAKQPNRIDEHRCRLHSDETALPAVTVKVARRSATKACILIASRRETL